MNGVSILHFQEAMIEAFSATFPTLFDSDEASYRDYLRHPGWMQLKRWSRDVFGRQCWVCGARTRLELAHLMYPAVPFTERVDTNLEMSDVALLCHTHHSALDILIWGEYFECEQAIRDREIGYLERLRERERDRVSAP